MPIVVRVPLLLSLLLSLFASVAAAQTRAPNRMGVIPVLEYHLIGERESRWSRNWQRFAKDLELLHARGYRPITVRQLVERKVDVGPGLSPVVITFDDASPGQFRFVQRGDSLVVDPTSAVGIWEAFAAKHPEWKGKAVFCMLPSATEGHAFFGDKGIQGQQTAWRMRKLRHLAAGGYELCSHTLWHANLAKMSAAGVQEQIARAQLAVDSAGTRVQMRTLALPLGMWPKDRSLLRAGSWTDPRTKRTTTYAIDAILMVAGGPAKSPFDTAFDPLRIPRVQVFANELETLLDRLDRVDRPGTRYVSGAPMLPAPRAR
jgi:peptidoglycan/xylan/chitin deacetylase (PgdA/CDA1 family)